MRTFSLAALLLAGIGLGLCTPAVSAQDESASGSRKVVSRVAPSYPSIARTLNLSGAVKLQAVVTPNGSVKSVQVLGGNPVLAQSAESAVRAWKWEKNDHETTERVEIQFNP